MNPIRSPRLLLAVSASLLAALCGGCVSKAEIAERRRYETDEQRSSREVFRSDWLIPSVSADEKDFFYRSWLRNSDY